MRRPRAALAVVAAGALLAVGPGAAQTAQQLRASVQGAANEVTAAPTTLPFHVGAKAGTLRFGAPSAGCRSFQLALQGEGYFGQVCQAAGGFAWIVKTFVPTSVLIQGGPHLLPVPGHLLPHPAGVPYAYHPPHPPLIAAPETAAHPLPPPPPPQPPPPQPPPEPPPDQPVTPVDQPPVEPPPVEPPTRDEQPPDQPPRVVHHRHVQPTTAASDEGVRPAAATAEAPAHAAPPPTVTPQPAQPADSPVSTQSDAERKLIQTLPVRYNQPKTLSFDHDTTVSFVVEGQGAGSSSAMLGALPGEQVGATARLTPSVAARLTGSADEVVIAGRSPEVQTVSTLNNTFWFWDVRGKKPGWTTLILTVEDIGSDGKRLLPQTAYIAKFKVQISPVSRVKYEIDEINPIWKWLGLGTPVALIAGAWTLWRKRRAKPGPPGPPAA